jgi:predicted dithiol-disulfide oxidoreductase (DUF899 family)
LRDELSAEQRALPWVEVEKDYPLMHLAVCAWDGG